MGQKEVDELRQLIQRRAQLLAKQKKAKGKALDTINEDLNEIQRRISQLDEKQN